MHANDHILVGFEASARNQYICLVVRDDSKLQDYWRNGFGVHADNLSCAELNYCETMNGQEIFANVK